MAYDQRPTIEELEPSWLDDVDRDADDAASQVPPHDDDAEAAVLSCIVTFATAAPHEDPRLAGVRAGIAAAFWRAGRPSDTVQVDVDDVIAGAGLRQTGGGT